MCRLGDSLVLERALTYLRIEAFDGALNDVSALVWRWRRKACSGERSHSELFSAYTPIEPLASTNSIDTHRRVAEKKRGVYDFNKLYKATKCRPPLLDAATFQGPVEVQESPGRGRYLYTTRAVKARELLLCEKAFAYCYAASAEGLAKAHLNSVVQTPFLEDVARDRITVSKHARPIRTISTKLAVNPSLRANFEDLSCGDYEVALMDRRWLMRIALSVRLLNSFGAPVNSRKEMLSSETYSKHLNTTGLWILPIYINHSCTSTCKRNFMGDLLRERAFQDMSTNTEAGGFNAIALDVSKTGTPRISMQASPRIAVHRWGVPVDGATSAWLSLRSAYKMFGQIELADQAEELARIS
ncbi:SET domain-containing protein [Diplocarpon rosae]|nr:SET domain-containing protein [Diplocarpon rosae]